MIVRTAKAEDTPQMAALLNEIIRAGGTTAIEGEVSADDIAQWMARAPDRSAWHVADADGSIMGFQWIAPHDGLPPEACDIATFAKIGATGQGIGTRLFAATREEARTLGYAWINAAIRSDNESGLTYYGRMGFRDWKHDPEIALSDGTVTGKTYKRFDL